MRYVLILSIVLSLADKTIASPARAGLLEIRGMPAARSKPILRLWERIAIQVTEKPTQTKLIASAPFLLGALIDPNIIYTLPVVALASAAGQNLTMSLREISASKLRGKHIHYTKQHDGAKILCRGCVVAVSWLCRGCVVGASPYESEVSVATTDSEKSRVPLDDIIGISMPDHPDLHKRVMLLSEADDHDFLRLTGKVSRVYDNGGYEIEVDNKFDYDLNEFPIDKSFTILVHISLLESEGGFTFIEGKTSEHNEAIQLAASAQQADVAQAEVELEHSVVVMDGK